MTLRKGTNVIIVLIASAYLFVGVASLTHFHKDGLDHNNCTLCYYCQTYHSQELPVQPSVVEVLLFQTFTFSKSFVCYTKIVFLDDPSRAPPLLQFV
jgi:hypothetical protein